MTSLDAIETKSDGAVPVKEPEKDNPEQRKANCEAAIQKVLAKHRCSIEPFLTGEPVGHVPGRKVLMVAMWGVVAEADG